MFPQFTDTVDTCVCGMGSILLVGAGGARNEIIIGAAHLEFGVDINCNHI
jgi:hypothetical protein